MTERTRTRRSEADQLRDIWRAIRAKEWPAAEEACHRVNTQSPENAAAWYAASFIAAGRGLAADALARIERALIIEPGNSRFLIQRAHSLLMLGRPGESCEAAAAAQRHAAADPNLFDAIGTAFSFGNDQARARAAYDEAVRLAPDNPRFIFNRATVLRYLGDFAAAEADYDRVIALKPDDYEAYKNRTDLRTQTGDRNHVGQLESLLAHDAVDWQGGIQLHYALAKEYEDLGDYERSFTQLQRGSALRRAHLRYDVATDVSTADWIIEAFPRAPQTAAAHADTPAKPPADAPAAAPIFIVGLPRTGTTLVDRILGSHSQIYSAGELHHFALAITAAVRRQSGRSQLPRRELIARSAALDFTALGRDYLARAHAAAPSSVRFTDKMPLNYLYCGLIRRALPNAKIVHLKRHPLAACYAMYKALFKDGYPFSYDLTEIGRYYIAYRRLMDHWQSAMPECIYALPYERLVADQLGETRRLLAFCDLSWEDACARFEQNPAPAVTASAAQVRRPIYDSSVALWRHYEKHLTGLAAQLSAAGIELGHLVE